MKIRSKNIITVLPIAAQDGLDKYAGIMRYINEHDLDWNLIIDRLDQSRETAPSNVDIESADGTIIDGSAPEAMRKAYIRTSYRPLAAVDWQTLENLSGRRNTVCINADDKAIADAAFKAITSNGRCASIAFMPALRALGWSKLRGRRLQELTRKSDIAFFGLSADRPLEAQLRALPKPAAVFAANDRAAEKVLKAAVREDIAVPQDLSVLGVDNSRFICLHSHPPLSSIQPDFEAAGYKAAAAIAAMLEKRKYERKQTYGVKNVIRRQSLEPFGTAGRLVQRARAIIGDSYTRKERIDEIAARVKVSRRLLDRRFRQITGKSILETITELRIEEACRLLRTTDIPISHICNTCALGSGTYPQRLFRRHMGMTMREYRTQNRQPAAKARQSALPTDCTAAFRYTGSGSGFSIEGFASAKRRSPSAVGLPPPS